MLRVLLSIILLVPCFLGAELSKVISIGSNDLNYLFFKVAAAAIDEDGSVYVLDSKGFVLRKFDPRGVFVREIGKHGQGPGDFSNVLSGMGLDRNIYVLDTGNGRIIEIDRDLNIKHSLRVSHQARQLARMDGLFFMVASRTGEPFSEIIVYDDKGEFRGEFFEDRPEYMKGPTTVKMEYALRKIYADLTMAVDKGSQEIAAAFKYPSARCGISVFSKEGRFKRRLEIDHLVHYDFPVFRLKWPVSFPGRSQLISLGSAHFVGPGQLLLEYWIETYESERAVEQKKYLLVIDTVRGKIIHREPLDPAIDIVDARGRFLCARQEGNDATKVVVYRLDY